MKLIPLGIYGAYPRKNGANVSYFLQSGDTKIAIDFGSGAISRIQNYIDLSELNAVVLSHTHADHASDMLQLRYYLQLEGKGKRLAVYLPKSKGELCKMISECPDFEIHFIQDNPDVRIGTLSLSFLEMTHPELCYGMRVTDGKRLLAYTGDTTQNQRLDALASGAHLLLCDSALFDFQRTESSPHMSVEQGLALAKKHGVKIMMTHFMTQDFARHIEAAENAGVLFELAKELTEYTV